MSKTHVVNFKCEEYDVKITRRPDDSIPPPPAFGCFGNPYPVATYGRAECIRLFKVYFLKRVSEDEAFRTAVLKLRGRKLGCFCAPAMCHGHVIAIPLGNPALQGWGGFLFFRLLPTLNTPFACATIPPMNAVRTVICKILPTPDQEVVVEETLRAFANGCNFTADASRRIASTDRDTVHAEVYYAIRANFGLSANLAARVIARTIVALKVPAKAHSTFAPTSIDYDTRIFNYREDDETFSLTMRGDCGRMIIATQLGEYQRAMLAGKNPKSATLVKRRDGAYYLHVQVKDVAPDPIATTGCIGVDLGVVNLAVTDDGVTFSGADVEKCRRRYGRIRRTCQKNGSKRAKRRLQKTRMKESRYRRDTNHKISKSIVAKAKGTSRAIGIEDLKGIRARITAKNKADRSRLTGWAFYQLREFITYKALLAGVTVIPVNPRNTSRTCSACQCCDKRNRKTRDIFECRKCKANIPADLNAAVNIRVRAEVLRPDVGASTAAKASAEFTGKPIGKPPALAVGS